MKKLLATYNYQMTIRMLFFWTIFCYSCSSENKAQELTKKHAIEDLDELMTELDKHHAGYTRYTSSDSMDYYFGLAKDNISDMSRMDFYKEVTSIVSKIRCGHTRASLPRETTNDYLDSNTFLPLTVKLLNGGVYVNQSMNPDIVGRGDEILFINNLSIDQIVSTIFDHLSSDGFIKTGKQKLTERFFNYYYQLYLSPENASYSLKLKNKGTGREVSVAGRSWDDLMTLQSNAPSSPMLSIQHEENYSYLKIGTFSNGSLQNNGYDYSSFLEESFESLKTKSVANLIIDLRGNGGGKDEFGALLNSYLLQKPFGYFDRIEVTEDYSGYGSVEHLDGRHLMTSHSGLNVQQVQNNNFQGKLYLLVDGRTFSTAADVVSVLENFDRAVIIGEETGGGRNGNTSGASKSVELSNSGVIINIPMWKYTTARIERNDSGRGVVPNYIIIPTIEQVLNGEDAQLNYCLQMIN